MKKLFVIILVILSLIVVGCQPAEPTPSTEITDSEEPSTEPEPVVEPETSEQPAEEPQEKSEAPAEEAEPAAAPAAWQDTPLQDVNTGESFKISDFRGKQVLLESFAVWCPTCTEQQRRMKKLHEELGDAFVSISLDTDPNEDEALVKDHTQANGFTWRYAISPVELTQALIDEFGVGVVNAPAVPMILVCENGATRFLPRGLKSITSLKEEMGKGC